MTTNPIPAGYEGATPYLVITGAAEALDFYQRAFGAEVLMRLKQPDGRIGHAEIRIGKAVVMLADEFPEMGFASPKTLGNSPVGLMLYVEDVDARFEQALAAGGQELRPMADQFYGDRSGTLIDPFGHMWTLASRLEDLAPAEVEARFEQMMQDEAG